DALEGQTEHVGKVPGHTFGHRHDFVRPGIKVPSGECGESIDAPASTANVYREGHGLPHDGSCRHPSDASRQEGHQVGMVQGRQQRARSFASQVANERRETREHLRGLQVHDPRRARYIGEVRAASLYEHYVYRKPALDETRRQIHHHSFRAADVEAWQKESDMGPPPYRWRTRLSQWREGAHVSEPAGCSWRAVGSAHIRDSCSCRASARRADLIGRKCVSTGRTRLLQVCYTQCTRRPPRAATRAAKSRQESEERDSWRRRWSSAARSYGARPSTCAAMGNKTSSSNTEYPLGRIPAWFAGTAKTRTF